MTPFTRDHPSYEVWRNAAESNPAKWAKFLQPEDRPTGVREATPTGRIRIKVKKTCAKLCPWRWVVLLDGNPTGERGERKSPEEATADAVEEAMAIAKEMGITLSESELRR